MLPLLAEGLEEHNVLMDGGKKVLTPVFRALLIIELFIDHRQDTMHVLNGFWMSTHRQDFSQKTPQTTSGVFLKERN